ncbi:MAG: hypothetical protein KC620_16600 [Myxococcales bacterium]|nr:hypothetical protein [Myxococcales bacterium]
MPAAVADAEADRPLPEAIDARRRLLARLDEAGAGASPASRRLRARLLASLADPAAVPLFAELARERPDDAALRAGLWRAALNTGPPAAWLRFTADHPPIGREEQVAVALAKALNADVSGARAQVEALLDAAPGDALLLATAAAIALCDGEAGEAAMLARLATEGNASPPLLAAQVLVLTGETPPAEASPDAFGQWAAAYALLDRADPQAAESILRQLLVARPADVALHEAWRRSHAMAEVFGERP